MNNENEVRRGIQQAKVGETGGMIVAGQVLGLSYIAGHFSGSIGLGLLAFVILIVLIISIAQNEKGSRYFSFLAGGLAAVSILMLFVLDEESSLLIGLVLALLGGGIIAGGNLTGLQHLRDIAVKTSDDDKG